MSFFEFIGRRIGKDVNATSAPVQVKSATLTDPLAMPIFGMTPTVSGRDISPTVAMRVPAVRAAVLLLSNMVGVTSFKIHDRENGKQPAPEHQSYHLVHDEPNDDMGAEEFRTLITADALLTDNGFAFVNRVQGRAFELIRLDPLKVQIRQNTAGDTIYLNTDGNDRRTYSRDEILHIKAPGGISPIKHAREAIALALELEACATRIFTKGGRPSGVLKFPSALTEDAAKRMSESWNGAHSGEQSGRTAVLEEGGDFVPFAFSSVDAEFSEMRRLQVVEIARAFGVPPTMLQILTNGTFANVEQLDLYFRTYTLRPLLVSWARAYGRALLTPGERARFYVEPVYNSLVAADTKTVSDALTKQVAGMIMTPNEARATINLAPHPDGERLLNPNTTSTTTNTSAVDLEDAA